MLYSSGLLLGGLTIYSRLADAVRSYNPGFDDKLLKSAYDFAEEAHRGQKRASGEDYFLYHPFEVAMIVATELRLDIGSIMVALLHDVAEDTKFTIEDIREKFGEVVAQNVSGVSKLSKGFFSSPTARDAGNFRKMIIAMAQDIRVILVKLCDRLHNMRTLMHLSPEKQKRISNDTLEIYAPLAHRLGVNKICYELEDLALHYLDPDFYAEIKRLLAKRKKEREEEIQVLERQIHEVLVAHGIQVDIQGRPKHFFSIYRKMKEGARTLESLHDLVGIRIITDSVGECYTILGLLHRFWRPVPGRFKDYIAVPKSNNYQSLHTTLIHHSGDPFEVQIRTHEMHEVAEKGIAAHWEYKVKEGKMNVDIKKTFAWLQQIIEWIQTVHTSGEFMNTVKGELFSRSVFCFTPKGDIFELPTPSTPLDFAYTVHTQVGHRCIGAKVNGNIVPLEYELSNGDIVKIITSKNPRTPPSSWLKIAKTATALKKIRAALKREMRDEYISRGQEIFHEAVKKAGGTAEDLALLKSNKFNPLVQKLGWPSPTELFLGIGNGELNPATIIVKLFPHLEIQELKEKEQKLLKKEEAIQAKVARRGSGSVLVNGEGDFLVRIARCCQPIPGDNIVGFITRGRGVSVHRAECPHLRNSLKTETTREVSVSWNPDSLKAKASNAEVFQINLLVETKDKPGILTNLTRIISKENINVVSLRADSKDQRGFLHFRLEVPNLNVSRRIIKLLTEAQDVLKVSRAESGRG